VGYYNPTFPLATLDLWPIPTSSDLEGAVYWPQGVSEIATLNTTVSVPPGYRRMIVKALSVELCPSYGKQVDPLLLEQATDAKEIVKRANKRMVDMSFEPAALVGTGKSSYDIYEG
jgi:hypothetical protein